MVPFNIKHDISLGLETDSRVFFLFISLDVPNPYVLVVDSSVGIWLLNSGAAPGNSSWRKQLVDTKRISTGNGQTSMDGCCPKCIYI